MAESIGIHTIDTNRIEANLERFNESVRRTSERLAGRAGSVPPEDRLTIGMPDLPPANLGNTSSRGAATTRGRGRGRGKKSTVNTRSSAAARNLAAATTSSATNPSTNGTNPTNGTKNDTTEVTGTQTGSVNQPESLIERDSITVNVTPNGSPAHRNTVTGTGISPPQGFHSWLAANGYTITRSQTTSSAVPNAIPGIIKSTNQDTSKNAELKKSSVKWVGIIDNATDVPAGNTAKTSETSTENAKVICDDEGIDTNGLVVLFKHFNTKMTQVKGYIPLSIFNPHCLHQDLLQQSFRQLTTKEKLSDSYVGLNVPLQWRMSFGEWVVAFDLFVAYCRHYTHEDLANKFVVHKQNVLEIMKENMNWPIAFRYDIAIRTTVMMICNANGNLANPAVRNKTIERQCFRDTERYSDFLPAYADINPYATGGPKEHINPITGTELTNAPISYNGNPFAAPSMTHYSNTGGSNQIHHQNNQHGGKPNARSWSHANGMIYNGSGGVAYQSSSEDRRNSGRNTRGRGRGGAWFNGGGGGRDLNSPPRYSDNSRRGEGSGSWRRDERRDDRRNDDCDYAKGHKPYAGNGKAK
ncbi:uncharacterized protein MELLADRAFT_87146 [Melampsora larici-populina 98AG31]|uniref:Uncharacterized protein n=1 Tax=Melampsora larici-populina (strain 98AG31 / pathotype 3-4-7) TaxID=747676 RepID=F4R4P0_MELLP|nr:uncharacterized protein MELLADRAFT_87146 [Melampsora larici-populina 98AG31]EGG12843.1 hypothetical protein MELLADRAFT_87146 [Melampsora larici-populina 98AG31]